MASSLKDFAEERQAGRTLWAWHMTLGDDLYNEIWDALQDEKIGARTVVLWLRSLGHTDVTDGKVKTIQRAKRR